jgi:hypothetical protein
MSDYATKRDAKVASTLAAIDAVTGCMGCGEQVPATSLSDLFCSEGCQYSTLRNQSDGHVPSSLGEDRSGVPTAMRWAPEDGSDSDEGFRRMHLNEWRNASQPCPSPLRYEWTRWMDVLSANYPVGRVSMEVRMNTSAWDEEMNRVVESIARVSGVPLEVLGVDELSSAPPRRTPQQIREQALEARRNRNTGPTQRRRPPRSIEPRGNR